MFGEGATEAAVEEGTELHFLRSLWKSSLLNFLVCCTSFSHWLKRVSLLPCFRVSRDGSFGSCLGSCSVFFMVGLSVLACSCIMFSFYYTIVVRMVVF